MLRVISNGYKYGEHRFTLDQDQVLDLFMGENLYEDPYVFVRELLQNAIDTSRHREHFERCRGNKNFAADPITVTDWRDNEGCQWVRFDDYGMGMDENIIIRYLLKVGVSYYRSSDFEAEKIRYSGTNDSGFSPISRFGIGLLSCFMVADRVEINTRRVKTDGASPDPVRLSLPGLHGFYTLQTGSHGPAPMPSENGSEPGYRNECGTSIALRIDPLKDHGTLNLKECLQKYVLMSTVTVLYEGESMDRIKPSFIEKPLMMPVTYKFTTEQVKEVERVLDIQIPTGISIHVLPLDITKNSPCNELKGQAVAAIIECSDLDTIDNLTDENGDYNVNLEIAEDSILKFIASYKVDDYYNGVELKDKMFATNVIDFKQYIPAHLLEVLQLKKEDLEPWNTGRTLSSHNGIALPKSGVEFEIEFEEDRSIVFGLICLSDSFRPELGISRESIITGSMV